MELPGQSVKPVLKLSIKAPQHEVSDVVLIPLLLTLKRNFQWVGHSVTTS